MLRPSPETHLQVVNQSIFSPPLGTQRMLQRSTLILLQTSRGVGGIGCLPFLFELWGSDSQLGDAGRAGFAPRPPLHPLTTPLPSHEQQGKRKNLRIAFGFRLSAFSGLRRRLYA